MLLRKTLENVAITLIEPNPDNPRRHRNIEAVKKSIQTNGYITPIIVDENRVILAGHARYEACVSLGWENIPSVVQITGLTDAQKKDFIVRDNKSTEGVDWNFEQLGAMFTDEQLRDLGFDIMREVTNQANAPTRVGFEVNKQQDFFLVMVEREEDFVYIVDTFQLPEVTYPKSNGIGRMRAIKASDLIRKMNHA